MIELEQALILTLVGMGMTFAAIGLLVAGMYAMTAFIKDKADDEDELFDEMPAIYEPSPIAGHPSPGDSGRNDADRRLAAAAAVATMLAEQQGKMQAAAAAVAAAIATADAAATQTTTGPQLATSSAWNTAIRVQRLSQRQYHDARRGRK
jgi:Na+-transporting methylmalonyl-CoA/oxaloacetate decarboxylase gamma subunit